MTKSVTSKNTTKTKKIELSIRRRTETQEFTVDQIAQMLNETEAKLNDVDQINKIAADAIRSGKVDKGLMCYDLNYGITKGDIKRSGFETYDFKTVRTVYDRTNQPYRGFAGNTTQPDYNDIDIKRFADWERDAVFLRKRLLEFRNRFNKDILKAGDWFPYFTKDTYHWDRKGEKKHDMIVSVGVQDQADCQFCGDQITMKGMALHQKRVTCKDKTYRLKLEKSGLVQVAHGSKLYQLAKRGLVPNELIAIDYDAFVPEWVVRGTEMFEKNLKENGTLYAGMKLQDFLDKMRPADAVDDLSAQVQAGSPTV